MSGMAGFRKPLTGLLVWLALSHMCGELRAGELPGAVELAPDTSGARLLRVSPDSLRFSDFLLLGSRDLGEAACWLPGQYLLRYGGFGQPAHLVQDGLFRTSLRIASAADPAVTAGTPGWSTWPVGNHPVLARAGDSSPLAGTPVQVSADFPWSAPGRPYTRVGYTSGAYGLSQVAVRFTEKVHSGVQLWLEGAHDLYEGYEPFSGLRNQLYVWRLDWSAAPTLRLRYWGRHFARDVDSPGLTSGQQALGTSLPFLPLVAKHRKDSWTDHVVEATWRPDSLGERELTITAAAGRGTAERSYRDLKCPAFVSKLSEGQFHMSFRHKRLRILGSIDRFREQPEGGADETWMAWRTRVSQRLSGILGGDVELGAGLGGGASKGFRKAGPEAFLRFGRAFGAVRAETELLTDTWLPSHELLPCSEPSFRAGHLTRRTKVALRLENGSEGWSWLTEIGAVRASNLPLVAHDAENGFRFSVSSPTSAVFSLGVGRPATHTFFGRAKLDFYSNPLSGIPRLYALVAAGVRRLLFQGDLDVRVLGLLEFISERTSVLPLDYFGYADSPAGFSAPAGGNPSVRVVARFKDARLFFQASQLFGNRLERAPGFLDDPLSYRWGIWWEFWN